jgi:hypothetical protein
MDHNPSLSVKNDWLVTVSVNRFFPLGQSCKAEFTKHTVFLKER